MKSENDVLKALDIARGAVEKLADENVKEGAVFGFGYITALEWVLGLGDDEVKKLLESEEED